MSYADGVFCGGHAGLFFEYVAEIRGRAEIQYVCNLRNMNVRAFFIANDVLCGIDFKLCQKMVDSLSGH